MKKYVGYFAISTSALLVINSVLKLFNYTWFKFDLLTYGLYGIGFVAAVVSLFFLIWRPVLLHIAALLFALMIVPLIQTEVNYFLFKNTRETIIEQVVSGELALNEQRTVPDRINIYQTPESYQRAVNHKEIAAEILSEEEYFVYFEAYQPPFDLVGYSEGFLYTSTGEPPTNKSVFFEYKYKQINENWFFVANGEDDLKWSCLFICGGIITND